MPDDPRGPLCGNPAVGFSLLPPDPGEPPGDRGPNTRVTQVWPEHWSRSNASQQTEVPGWVIGTDGTVDGQSEPRDDYGFYWTLGDRPGGSWGDTLADGLVEVRIRNLESRQVREYVPDSEDGHWEGWGPAPYDPSEQSDGWFRFRVRVNAANYPPECPGTIGPCIPFRLNMGDTGHGVNRYFTEGGYDWNAFRPLYRTRVWNVTVQAWTFGAWRRAAFVYARTGPQGQRRPEAIYAVPVLPECDSTTGCFIEVAQTLPYTKLDRDAFADEVEAFCGTSPYCKVYRGGSKPWTTSAPAETGLADLPLNLGPDEDNDFVFIEFAPFDLDEAPDAEALPDNVILITAGVHYEPNTMFAAEGVVRALMASVSPTTGLPVQPSVLFGDGTSANPPMSFAIVFGASPDNLSWATTHVAPWGDGNDVATRKTMPGCNSTWRFYDEDPSRPPGVYWTWPGSWQVPVEHPDEFLWNTALWPFDFHVNPILPLTGTEGYDEYVCTPACVNDSPFCYSGYDFVDSCRLRFNDDPESVALRHYTWPGDDCDDSNPAVGPGGIEICDGVDNDCNGVTDDEDEVCGLEICHLRTVCAGANGCLGATDSDGDWLADVDEATWFGSANDADTDDDGLPDGVEVCLANGGLCPSVNAADSDGDTLSDAAEAVLGTNLCEPDTDDDRLSDAEDPTPTIPGAPRAYLEDECRALGDFISSVSYTLFYGATTLEKKGKRTTLASYAYTAANKLASNLPSAVALAEEQLLALLLYVDGAGQPDDWMVPSSEKTAVYDETDLLLYLLAYL